MKKIHLPTRWGGLAKPGWGGWLAQSAALMLLVGCNQGAPAAVPSGVASGPRQLVAAPEYLDQPSFAKRTSRIPTLSLQGLFHPTYTAPDDPSRIRTLLVTGDVIPSRGVNFYATQRRDFLWPFRPTADFVKNADITFIDLEAPLFTGCPVSAASSFTFCGDPRFMGGLKLMGADVANLANNHTSNYGAEGISPTSWSCSSTGARSTNANPWPIATCRPPMTLL